MLKTEQNIFIFIHTVVLLLLSIGNGYVSSDIPRPRGVPLSRAALYDPQKDFTCFDGSLTVPFSQVNDDYCDCPDGSDEPGTSACPHGAFHCTNAGHKPLNLPASRVNDGICDCCDASDEYANPHAKCANNCAEQGRSAREEAQKKAELIRAGKQLRAELAQYGAQRKEEKKGQLAELQREKAEAERVKSEKEGIKKQLEELEAAALEKYRKLEEEEKRRRLEEEQKKSREEAVGTFKTFDSNGDGKIELAELQTRQSFDKDRNGEVSEEEARYFLNGEDAVDEEKFVTDAWANIKPYLMLDAGLFKPPAGSEAEDMQGEQEAEAETTEGEGEAGEGYEEENEEDGDAHEDTLEDEEEEEQPPASPKPNYDEETQKLVDQASEARNEFFTAEKAVRDIQSSIQNIEDYLSLDFGPEEEYASLQGDCFEYTDHEYIYKLCPFDKTTQKPKSGAAETRLGAWSGWAGPPENVHEVMLFDKGQQCWNGPQRSTRVKVSCGGENKVTSVSEPNRCEYAFEFVTPAACREIPAENQEDVHDEL